MCIESSTIRNRRRTSANEGCRGIERVENSNGTFEPADKKQHQCEQWYRYQRDQAHADPINQITQSRRGQCENQSQIQKRGRDLASPPPKCGLKRGDKTSKAVERKCRQARKASDRRRQEDWPPTSELSDLRSRDY